MQADVFYLTLGGHRDRMEGAWGGSGEAALCLPSSNAPRVSPPPPKKAQG